MDLAAAGEPVSKWPRFESELYGPVRDFLSARGYRVNGEVRDCDLTATSGDELIVVELKKSFNATLLIQAAERQKVADSVYVALPRPANIRKVRNWRGMCHLLRRLELGLILVREQPGPSQVQIQFHPLPLKRRKKAAERRGIIREINGRTGDHNIGGSRPTRRVTAYREDSIYVACCLEAYGDTSPAELRKLGAADRTQSILYQNYYGWFDRIDVGMYALTGAGKEALTEFAELATTFRKQIRDRRTHEHEKRLAG